jgi:hypothetical protein
LLNIVYFQTIGATAICVTKMNNSKLISLFYSFSKPEFKQLKGWIKLHALHKEEMLLFGYLADMHPELQGKKLEKEIVFGKLWPAQDYDDNKMRHLQSVLTRHAEQFIIHQLNADEYREQFSLLKFYRQRGLDKYFEQQLALVRKMLQGEKIQDSSYYYHQMLADEEYNKYIKGKQKRTLEPNIQSLSDNLDHYYIINKLSVYAEALNYKNIIKTNYEIGLIAPLLQEISAGGKFDVPAINVRHVAVQTLLDNDNEQHFHNLKKLLHEHAGKLDREQANDLNTLARNYCINRINKGHSKFARDLFELYQLEISSIQPGYGYELSPAVYKNAVTLAFNLKETEWAFDFIKRYSPLLPAAQQAPNYTFNMARYYFIGKQYNDVIALLSRIEYSDLFMMLSAKILLLKTYYELDETGPFESLVHSFRSLLKNKSTIGYYHANYSNFARFAEKLFRKGRYNKAMRHKLLAQIEATKSVAEKEWLLEKAKA